MLNYSVAELRFTIIFLYLCNQTAYSLPNTSYMNTDIKDSITTREKEILSLLAIGLSSKEISDLSKLNKHII